MASKKCSLICVVLFLCIIMSFSTKAIARNIRDASEVYANEMGQNRKLFIPVPPDQRCKRGRKLFIIPAPPENKAQNDPRCHNYL
ncbi:hypothetical protein QL285_067415 [Trifolium repens]|nr:hypothetical protein QL285_067415 [Trifolium repens]